MKTTQVFGTAPVSKHPRVLNLPPNSAFPFFDWKMITMPTLVFSIISMIMHALSVRLSRLLRNNRKIVLLSSRRIERCQFGI